MQMLMLWNKSPKQVTVHFTSRDHKIVTLNQNCSGKDVKCYKWLDIEQFRARDKQYRAAIESYNRRHRVTTLPDLKPGERVWHRELNQPATIIREAGTPRSYIVSNTSRYAKKKPTALVPRHRAWEHPNDEPSRVSIPRAGSRSHYLSHRVLLQDKATGQPVENLRNLEATQ